jgi:hypothetical protein
VSYVWSTWLADALRADPWLAPRVIERAGWQTFGRPPSDFSYNPSGLIDHHTACCIGNGHDPQSCVNGIVAGNSSAPGPIAQLLGTWTPPGTRWNGANADPRVVVIAAGRCNHAGDGAYPWGAPAGNGSAIGIEWCGPPPGAWPDIIIEARERTTAALLAAPGWTTRQLTTHNEYVAPVRPGDKIDPSGSWSGEPGLAQMTPWNASTWRARVDTRLSTPKEDDLTDDQFTQLMGVLNAIAQAQQADFTQDGTFGPKADQAISQRSAIYDALGSIGTKLDTLIEMSK